MYEHWSDKITVTWDITIGPISFVANLASIFIILKYTPETTKTYASIILTMTISDCCSFLGTIMTSARLKTKNSSVSTIRISEFFPAEIRYSLSFVVCVYTYLKMISIREQYFVNFNWVYYMAIQPMDLVSREFAKIQPEIVESNATYYGVIYMNDPSQIVFNILSIASSSVTIIIIILCRWRTVHFSRKFHQSEVLKKLHKSLEHVFFCQAFGPILTTLSSFLYMLAQENVSDGYIILSENLIGRPIVFMYIVNPVVTVFFITPYRNAVIRWFRKHPVVVVAPISTTGDA